jgi:hypothetical protein
MGERVAEVPHEGAARECGDNHRPSPRFRRRGPAERVDAQVGGAGQEGHAIGIGHTSVKIHVAYQQRCKIPAPREVVVALVGHHELVVGDSGGRSVSGIHAEKDECDRSRSCMAGM